MIHIHMVAGTVPNNYHCSQCSASACKLYRQIERSPVQLFCRGCAALVPEVLPFAIDFDKEGNELFPASDEIVERKDSAAKSTLLFIPAIPDFKNGWYSYPDVPVIGLDWWMALPHLPPSPQPLERGIYANHL